MSTTETLFQQLESELQENGALAALDHLAGQLREQNKFHELFEALKMRARVQLGLPLLYQDAGDDLDEETRGKLEQSLLDACREVGTMLLRSGQLREGWM